MASEWKEKGGGDDFDDEGLPLLRKHTQVRPNTRRADSVYSLQTAFLVRPRRNDAGVGATPSLSPRPEPARTSPKYRHSIDARYSIGSGDEPRARARVRPAHPAQPRRTNVEASSRPSWRNLQVGAKNTQTSFELCLPTPRPETRAPSLTYPRRPRRPLIRFA